MSRLGGLSGGRGFSEPRGIRFGVREWLSAAKRWLSSFQLRFASRLSLASLTHSFPRYNLPVLFSGILAHFRGQKRVEMVREYRGRHDINKNLTSCGCVLIAGGRGDAQVVEYEFLI